jgi:hypothetical protein
MNCYGLIKIHIWKRLVGSNRHLHVKRLVGSNRHLHVSLLVFLLSTQLILYNHKQFNPVMKSYKFLFLNKKTHGGNLTLHPLIGECVV